MDAVYCGLTAAAVVLLIWYYIVYYQAERPRAGTLEWIDRWEKPRCELLSCGKKLRPTDALWALLTAAVAFLCALFRQDGESLYEGLLGVLLRFSLGEATYFLSGEVLCAAFTAAALYLLGKALTGRTFAALAGALLFAVQPGVELYSVLLAAGLLCLWLFASRPVRGFAAWLLLSGASLLLGAAAFSVALPPVAVSLLVTLPVVCAGRARALAHGSLYAVLQIVAALLFAVLGYFGIAALLGDWAVILASPGAWLAAVFTEQSAVVASWLTAPLCLDRLLRFPLLLSGVVPLFVRWCDRNSGDALFLLLWALPAAIFYAVLPAMLPIVIAALVCAWLTGRLLERGHPCAAAFGALGAIAVCGLQDLIWDFFYLTLQF